MEQNYINHVVLVLDASGSMSPLANTVVQVADNEIAHLAQRSKELDQETRATIYTFDTNVICAYYDKDVLRVPSLRGKYKIGGSTALIDATLKSVEDLRKTATLYGDHAFLIYILTDGEDNASRTYPNTLRATIAGLPDNWTLAVLVPDQRGVHEAKNFGFAPQNIAVWDSISERGVREVGETIRRATENFMTQRPQGFRGTRNLFQVDASNLNVSRLTQLTKGSYRIFDVSREDVIRPFVENQGLDYRLGCAYYQLTKTEEIQSHKEICVMDKSYNVYTGREARTMLGLPDYAIKVTPDRHPDVTIFVQSTSVNRKLMPGTKLLVIV